MGPWRPCSTSHYFSSLCSPYTMGVFICLWTYVAYDTYFEGCFLDVRLLLLCIGVWPCRTVYVYMLKWVWRRGGSDLYVASTCAYVYVVMLKWVIGTGGTVRTYAVDTLGTKLTKILSWELSSTLRCWKLWCWNFVEKFGNTFWNNISIGSSGSM